MGGEVGGDDGWVRRFCGRLILTAHGIGSAAK